jgi:hypothetical protein
MTSTHSLRVTVDWLAGPPKHSFTLGKPRGGLGRLVRPVERVMFLATVVVAANSAATAPMTWTDAVVLIASGKLGAAVIGQILQFGVNVVAILVRWLDGEGLPRGNVYRASSTWTPDAPDHDLANAGFGPPQHYIDPADLHKIPDSNTIRIVKY